MRFRTESAKTYHPKQTPEGSNFWQYGIISTDDKFIQLVCQAPSVQARSFSKEQLNFNQ